MTGFTLMPMQVKFNSQFELPRKGISSEEFSPSTQFGLWACLLGMVLTVYRGGKTHPEWEEAFHGLDPAKKGGHAYSPFVFPCGWDGRDPALTSKKWWLVPWNCQSHKSIPPLCHFLSGHWRTPKERKLGQWSNLWSLGIFIQSICSLKHF